jgi:protein-disulfide isomerase
MENPETNDSRWTGERMASLDPPSSWTPNAEAALSRLRSRQRAWRRRLAGMFAGVFAAAACLVLLMLLSAPQACAQPTGCSESFWTRVFPRRAPAAPSQPTAPVNFRESGDPHAAIEIEIYSDYECPACAAFFRDVVPRLTADYVKAGKVRLLHRDFPLPRHRYAGQAARSANAAGRLGYYDAAVRRIFETQEVWNTTGDVDSQLAAVLPPEAMQKLRQMVAEDASLDAAISDDRAQAVADQVPGTPTLVVVAKGKRQTFFPAPRYDLLQGYLNALLAP